MKIIATTGTKGKTTVTRMLDHVVQHLLETDTLRVDSDGHFISGKQKSTHRDSIGMSGKASTICPGRYLIDLYRKNPDGVALLECALGCGGPIGIGYRSHDIGIFTNVYQDHINDKNVKNRRDIFKLKDFIIRRVAAEGYLVANFDDNLIAKHAEALLPKDAFLLPFGKTFKGFDTETFLQKKGNRLLTYDKQYIILKSKNQEVRLIDHTKVAFTYQGLYAPSVYNLMAVYGALLVLVDFDLTRCEKINRCLYKFSLDKYGARLVNLKIQGRLIIIDYAHETESLKALAKLGHRLGKKVIGVLRLAPDRTDAKILETGAQLAPYYDQVVIYDKIDGVKLSAYKRRHISRKVGEVSKLFYEGFLRGGKCRRDLSRIVVEKEAIQKAYELSSPQDVIVVISGDDHRETYDNVKNIFEPKAEPSLCNR